MLIGSFGNIVFAVHEFRMRTFNDLKRKRTIKHAKHDVLEGKPRLQHTGRDLDAVSFSVVLMSMFPGDLSPDDAITQLLDMAEAGDEQPLVFGIDYWGLWFLESVNVAHKNIHMGITTSATVDLSLTEYN